jgi:hypothetical protein
MRNQKFKLNRKPQKKSVNKWLLATLALVTIAGMASGGYIFIKQRNTSAQNIAQKNRDEAQTGSAKKETRSDSGEPTKTKGSGLPEDSTTKKISQVPSTNIVSVKIADFTQSDRTVSATANITGNRTQGTCVFSYTTTDAKPVVEQMSSVGNICTSKISEVKFNKLGEWNMSVTFYLDNTKSEVSQNVTIN